MTRPSSSSTVLCEVGGAIIAAWSSTSTTLAPGEGGGEGKGERCYCGYLSFVPAKTL